MAISTKGLRLALVLPLLACIGAWAQAPAGMSQADMQKMMGAMQEVQACYQNIDQKELQALQTRSEKFMTEVQQLCEAGKRADAQNKVLAYAKTMQGEPTLQKIRKCGEKLPDSIKSMVKAPEDYSEYVDNHQAHVCDSL